MNTNSQSTTIKSIIGLVFGLVSLTGISATASAASDFKVISKHQISMGDWDGSKPWNIIRFHLPENYDHKSDVVLQMNIRSTNKSKYNAIYLNDFEVDEYEGCDPVGHDRNEHARVDFLPYSSHNQWSVYHNVIEGERLQPGDNYLLVCARNKQGKGEHELDNFFVKDIVLQYREYKPAPQFCPRNVQPVCGVDGMTYSNACEADSAEVEIYHEGTCGS